MIVFVWTHDRIDSPGLACALLYRLSDHLREGSLAVVIAVVSRQRTGSSQLPGVEETWVRRSQKTVPLQPSFALRDERAYVLRNRRFPLEWRSGTRRKVGATGTAWVI